MTYEFQISHAEPARKKSPRSARFVSTVVFCFLLFASSSGICLSANAQKVVDQILMLVNDDIITRTDLLWGLALDPKAPNPSGPVSSDLLSRKLDAMIDQRLIAQEAGRVPSADVSQNEIKERETALIKQFPSEAAYRQRVESVGLTPERINELIREMILIERFVEFRFRSFILITEQDIQRYYDEKFAPEMQKGGQVPPSLDQVIGGVTVRESINKILKQEKINEEIDRWINAARQRADIVQLAEV